MRAKKIVYFFSVLLLFSGLMCSVDALSDTTVSFRGGGVTIDLTYPDEAYPNTNITHYITITSTTAATLRNFTAIIKAPVNSAWQEIFNAQDTFSKPLPTSYNLTLLLPQEANGMLQCSIFVNTSSIDDLSTTFYTTLVSEPTFSEIQSMYDSLWENYTILQADYETKLNEYGELLANYSSLFANYTALLSEHNELIEDYNSQVATYASMLAQYDKLSADYDTLNSNYRSKITELGDLQSDYDDLNSTRNSLQTSYDTLQAIYEGLNQTYTDLQTELANLQERINASESELNSSRIVMFIFIITVAALIAFIVYIKRKEPEPYVVIRKETVAMKSDEES
jgi:predicted nuclease with TOPRIM domain